MKEYQSLSHTRWDCKCHVVFIPKRSKKTIFGALRKHFGEVFREFLRHDRFKQISPKTITDPLPLLQALQKARREAYAEIRDA